VKTIRVKIKGKDEYWSRAFHVEWEDQFPDRSIIDEGYSFYMIDPSWLEDVKRVAAQCFCEVMRAPDNPQRRRLISWLVGRDDDY
jgi:hypothetical protein